MTSVAEAKIPFAAEFDRIEPLRSGEPAWLADLRRTGWNNYNALGFPTQRLEDWRFTNPAPIAELDYVGAPAPSLTAADVAPYLHSEYAGAVLVFANGQFVPTLSRLSGLPAGATVLPMQRAIAERESTVRAHLSTIADGGKFPFAAMNAALMHDGVFVELAEGTKVAVPIQIVFVTAAGAAPHQAHTRNLFVFGSDSEATLIESHVAIGAGVAFDNIVTEVSVAANANIDHYVVQQASEAAYRVSGLYLRQDTSSLFRSHAFDFGGRLVRNNLVGYLEGTGCEAILNGLYFLRGNQHVDNFMWVEHMKENIPSHELYKGVLDDNASSVFTGRIYVHQEAQKTDAKQTNQNLILTDTARATTKPQLEIYADDVKCTHGATIGQLDETALFYLRSRGIGPKQARDMLIQAFAGDVIDRIRPEALRERVGVILMSRMPETA